MGELTSGGVDPGTMASNMRTEVPINDPNKVATDVEDVFADGQKDNMPVFDIDHENFYSNMKADRRRIRFKGDSSASQYMRKTRYNRPFYLRTTDQNGQQLLRKVK